jgi:hypothetical protein
MSKLYKKNIILIVKKKQFKKKYSQLALPHRAVLSQRTTFFTFSIIKYSPVLNFFILKVSTGTHHCQQVAPFSRRTHVAFHL